MEKFKEFYEKMMSEDLNVVKSNDNPTSEVELEKRLNDYMMDMITNNINYADALRKIINSMKPEMKKKVYEDLSEYLKKVKSTPIQPLAPSAAAPQLPTELSANTSTAATAPALQGNAPSASETGKMQ